MLTADNLCSRIMRISYGDGILSSSDVIAAIESLDWVIIVVHREDEHALFVNHDGTLGLEQRLASLGQALGVNVTEKPEAAR